MEFAIPESGYLIRPPMRAEAKAVRMLLPGMAISPATFIAVDGRHQLVIGAAVATRDFRRKPLPGPGIAVHVIAPCRGRGIARQLVARLALAASAAGARALYAAKRVELHSDEMRAWEALGFSRCETVERHRLPVARIEEQLAPLLTRIRAGGRVPASAQMIPLYRSNLPAVLQLHLDHLGGDRTDLDRRLRGRGALAFLPLHSRVLLVDDKVRGCILGHRADADTIVVDANIIHPSIRGGWANAWLKLEAARGVVPLGVKYLEFTTFDRYDDTRSFIRKLGGETTRTSVLMSRPLEPGPPVMDHSAGVLSQ